MPSVGGTCLPATTRGRTPQKQVKGPRSPTEGDQFPCSALSTTTTLARDHARKVQMVSEGQCSGTNQLASIVVGANGSPTSPGALGSEASEACVWGATPDVVHEVFSSQDAKEFEAAATPDTRQSAVPNEAIAEVAPLAPGILVVAAVYDPSAASPSVNRTDLGRVEWQRSVGSRP